MKEIINCVKWIILLALTHLAAGQSYSQIEKLREIFSWKALDFLYPNPYVREAAIKSGKFKPGSLVPIDVDVYYEGKVSTVFVSIPRFQDGVPATLGYITDKVSSEGNPLIAPYPSWEWNALGPGKCDGITSVYRVQVDCCGRLWVLDTGKVIERQMCRPQLHAFDLKTKTRMVHYKFPNDQFKDSSLYVTASVDVRDCHHKCRDTFVYIADVTGFALIVYDYRSNKSWRIDNKLFYPYPQYGTFDIKGESFDLMDGILGLALGPLRLDGDKILYFHSLAGRAESWVPTSIIRNHRTFETNSEATPRSFQVFQNERSSQSAAEAMDENGVLFFGLMSDLAIGCWNSNNYPEYGGNNIEIVAQNPDTLQFISGLKVISSTDGKKQLWVQSVSFQKLMTGSLNSNVTNFRIQAGFLDELVRGTKCDVASLEVNANLNYGPMQFPK